MSNPAVPVEWLKPRTLPRDRWQDRLVAPVLCLLTGLGLSVQMDELRLSLSLSCLLPLLAVWWAQQRGTSVALPLVLFTLVPDLTVSLAVGLRLGFGYPDFLCLLSAGLALCFGRGAVMPPPVAPVVSGTGRKANLWTALGLAAYGLVENTSQRMGGLEFSLTIDVLAVPAVVLLWCALDWRRVSAALGGSAGRFTSGFSAAAVLLGLVVQLRWTHVWLGGETGFGIGSNSASFLAPVVAFWIVLSGWARWTHVLILFAGAALIGFGARAADVSLAAEVLGLHGHLAPDTALVHGGAAVMMGVLMRHRLMRPDVQAAWSVRERAWLAAVIATVVFLPVVFERIVWWDNKLWSMVGVCFLGGIQWGRRGALGTPLLLITACGVVAILMPGGSMGLTNQFPTLAGVMQVYGLGGWLAARRRRVTQVQETVAPEGLIRLDLSALARVIQTIDQAAVVRAFGALLVPAIIVGQWAGLIQWVNAVLGMTSDFEPNGPASDWTASIWAMGILGLVLSLWPLVFVLTDWIHRQDRWHASSGVVCGALALTGTALLALGAGWGLFLGLKEASVGARCLVAGGLLGLAGLLGWWQRWASARRGPIGLLLLTLLLLSGVGALLVEMPAFERQDALWPMGVDVALVLGAVVWWTGSIRRHLVLAEEHPRALLYGELPSGHFWVRMAALLGLPSSTWQRDALQRPATLAFLIARPLVYLGASQIGASVWSALALITAGHGVFAWGKRQAALEPWRPRDPDVTDTRAPVLFLRSFEDDQFDFRRPWWQLHLRWFDLWSFRRHLDEALVDEIAIHGPVVALGRPGEAASPFGAQRHYASHADWQDVIRHTACSARAIVLVAGDSPGLRWEFNLLRTEQLLDRTLLFFHPDPARQASNQRAIEWLLGEGSGADSLEGSAAPVALWFSPRGPCLLTVDTPCAAAYLGALRAHFQRLDPGALTSVIDRD